MKNQSIIRRYRVEISSVKDLLFYFLLAWTAMMLTFAWLTFFFPKLHLSDAIITSYFVLLSVYITHKEVSRWAGVPINVQPGEIMVLLWWISLFIMAAVGFFINLEVPFEMRQIAYDVLAAFLVSSISKSINIYRKTKQQSLKQSLSEMSVIKKRVSRKNLKVQKEHLPI